MATSVLESSWLGLCLVEFSTAAKSTASWGGKQRCDRGRELVWSLVQVPAWYLSLAPGADGPQSSDAPSLSQSEAAQLLHRHLHGNPTQLSDQGLREGRHRAVDLGQTGDRTNAA